MFIFKFYFMDNSNYYFNRCRIPRSIKYSDKVYIAPKVDVPEQDKALLDLIFAPDPLTGIPHGDLAIFTNKNANPEVKRFIELNLVTPISDSGGVDLSTDMTNKIRESITDDDIARFSRGRDESKEEYAQRIRQWFDDERQRRYKENQKAQFEKDLKNARERLSV